MLKVRISLASTALVILAGVGPTGVVAQTMALDSALQGLEWRELGPAVVGGRVSDLAVDESNPATFYVGTATSGVWKTTSAGFSWTPIFDDQPTASIGDVTLAPSNPNLIWVGTGEPQNRQSSPWGAGLFKSTDAGLSWEFMGLEETRHVSRIRIHPVNQDIVYVAAVGHLWGPNPERGVYKTLDGGKTWTNVLFIDENTGAIDLVMDPGDPNTLFAAMYQRRRTSFGFSASGSGSGIYRTTDGGETWRELTNGLPSGDKGRIGLDVYRRDGNLLFALVESRSNRGRGLYRSRDRGESWELVSETNPRPMYFSQVRIDPNDPERIYIGGVQFGISDDGGRTFRDGDGAPGIHVDHHALWINPDNSNHLILGSDGGVSTSYDRAETWRMFNNMPMGQFYEIGVDMRDPYFVCGGLQDNSSWCGPIRTLTNYGIRNSDWYDVSGGDGFYNQVDPTNPNIMYSESQGGNISRVDVSTGESVRIRPLARPTDEDEDRSYRFNWNSPIVISTHDPATVYIGANHLMRSRDRGVTWEEASPDLSRQIDRDTLPIMGMLPHDSTLSRNDGISSYGNITTIAESPLDAAVLYVGTDDGNLQVTTDGGITWTNLTVRVPNLPDRTYVSRIEASHHAPGRVYATFDGHYDDDYQPHVYVSENHGDSWQKITNGLPNWSVNVIREHHRTENLLFVGNEVGVYTSIDRGNSWTRIKNNLPTVPVDDIVIHPRENDLLLGTHGRSIWVMDDITPLEHVSTTVLASAGFVFPVRDATLYSLRGGWPFWSAIFQADNPPDGAVIRYYVGPSSTAPRVIATETPSAGGGPSDDTQDDAQDNDSPPAPSLTITTQSGELVRKLDAKSEPGIHEVVWDFRTEPPFETEASSQGGFFGSARAPRVIPGTYTARLEIGGETFTTPIRVLGDPRIEADRSILIARQQVLEDIGQLAKAVRDAREAQRKLTTQLSAIDDLVGQYPDLPDALSDEVDSLVAELSEIDDELDELNRATRLAGAIEGSTTRPTTDQAWQIEQSWSDMPAVVERLNAIISERLPALNRQLDQHGVRPKPGEPIPIPQRIGR